MHVFGFIAPDKYVLYCSVPRLMKFAERLLHGKDDKGERPQAVQGLK